MTAFDNIRLEKGLYASGDFTGALEKIDPSENYSGTALEGLDAYQRQLKRFNIKVSGAGSDVVDKFFKTSDSAVLFPEYVSRAVRQGMQEANVLPRIVASTTVIDSLDYRSIACEPSDDEKELKVVAEGAFIPETSVKSKENLVHLKKRGRSLVASYEAVRFQRLDLFTVTLRQIGAYIARTQLSDAVDVLINGDGNNNAAANTAVESAGKLTYTDLVNFWNLFDPYELNTIIAAPAQVADARYLRVQGCRGRAQFPCDGRGHNSSRRRSYKGLLRACGQDNRYRPQLRPRNGHHRPRIHRVRQAHRPPARARGYKLDGGLCKDIRLRRPHPYRLTAGVRA